MKKLLFAFLVAAVTAASPTMAGNIEAGKAKSAMCTACHGANGISPNGMWPNLAGQKEAYLASQIRAFRDGKRQNAQMAPMVANLSDTDVANLAAYYSSLDCQ